MRKKNNVSQAGLASQLTKGQTTVGNWEGGTTQPSVEDIILIKQFFGISLDDLILTDLRNVHPTELEGILNIKAKVHPNVHPSVQLKRAKRKDYAEEEGFPGMVNEADPGYNWATLRILQVMDKKLDQIIEFETNKSK